MQILIYEQLTDTLIDPNKRIKLLPAEFYRRIKHQLFRVWCVRSARYGIPTKELIEWLNNEIAGASALEIGAGNGDLGWYLEIPRTDSYCQLKPELQAYYRMIGQATTTPPPDVEKLDALDAIAAHQPDVVIGSWITQLYKEGDTEASVYGVDEEQVLTKVKKYIHIGNLDVHGKKRILDLPHKTFQFPWLVSRGANQGNNVIHVWER